MPCRLLDPTQVLLVGILLATGQCSSVESPSSSDMPAGWQVTATGTSSPYSTHTNRHKPPPCLGCECRAGRGLQVFSAGSSAQPTLQGLPQATSFQALEAGFPLWSYGLLPIRTAQLSAPFLFNRAADISPRHYVQGTGGKRCQWKADSGRGGALVSCQ